MPLRDPVLPSKSVVTAAEAGDERRTVTVLHADLCGYTRLSERLDPEQTRSLIDALFKALSRVIEAQGGRVGAYVGDAVLAVFGATDARTDTPSRAVQAAAAIHRVLQRFSHPNLDPLGARLQMRVGIDLGPVVLGRIGGLRRSTVTGATVAAAMELERSAQPGATLIGESARRQLPDSFAVSARLLPSGRLAYELRYVATQSEASLQPGEPPMPEQQAWSGELPLSGPPPVSGELPLSGPPPVSGELPLSGPPTVSDAPPAPDRSATVPADACYRCGHASPPDARFCGACGHTRDGVRCPVCDALNAAESRFCGRCGSSIADDPLAGAPEEQLRQVTVLFALLTDLEELIQHLDPQAFKDLLDSAFKVLTAEVVARGGTIDKYMADSLLALFGVPVAHEDDPDRAVAAALAMQDALEAFNRRLFATRGFQLGLKIGINTGKVLVGYVGGGAYGATVMGDVVNTASRVEYAAPVNGVLVCDSTRRALGDRYTLRSQPPLIVKGKARPLIVHRVLRANASAQAASLDLSHVPLVGREQEFEALASCWGELVRPASRDGDSPGVWVTLVGDVGLGTDRLLREFHDYTALDPCRPAIHTTRGLSFATGSGAEVLRRLLESLAGLEPGEDPERCAAKILELSHRIGGVDPETGESVRPELVARALARLGGLRLPDTASGRRPEPIPKRSRLQPIAWLVRICARLALEHPLLIIASELQWAEDGALDFFEALGKASPHRVMLVTATRHGLFDRRPGWAQDVASHRRIALRPLSLRDAQALVRAIAGDENPLPPRVVEALHRFTGGNPFYLTEALRYLLEARGTRDEATGRTEVNAGATGTELEGFVVPDSIEGVVQSRLDRLSFEEGLTLRAAAVIGPTFWRSAVTAVLGRDRGEALEHLSARGFIQRCATASIPGEEEYTFEHVLTVRVAAGNLLESVRRRYQLAAAEWLIERSSPARPLDLSIAHHLEAAGASERAIPFYARAADRLLASYDCGEAIRLYERALTLMGGFHTVDVPLKAHLLAHRGEARRMLNDLDRALVDFQAAAAAALQVGQVLEAAASWYRAGLVYLAIGAVEPAVRAAETGDRLVAGRGGGPVPAVGLQLRAELCLHRGARIEARQVLEQTLAEWRRLGDRWGLAHSLNMLGNLLSSQADYSAAQRAYRDAASLRETLGDSHGLANTLHNLGTVADCLGSFSEALGFYHRSLRLHRRIDNRVGQAATLMNQGVGYLRCGYLGRARTALEESIQLHRQLERPWGVGACQANLGHLWLQVGQLEAGAAQLSEAAACFRGLEDGEALAEVLIDLALNRLQEGRSDEAARLADEAAGLTRSRPASRVEALLLLLFGRLALARGEIHDAWQYLEETEWNDASQATPELELKAALLAGAVALESGQAARAISRLEEGEGIALSHDLVPGLWETRRMLHRAQVQARDFAAAATAASAAGETFRELLARIEAPEIIILVQRRATEEDRSQTSTISGFSGWAR